VARFLPFVGAAGLFLFKAPTWIILLGIGLATFGVGLFFLRSSYPRLAKDYDAVFAVVFCLCGILLLFQEYQSYGNQEIPITQFLLAGAGIFSAAECIRSRGINK
ncbi:serine/threonine protein kinase, partial [Fischerella thermalis CCMEE 5328]